MTRLKLGSVFQTFSIFQTFSMRCPRAFLTLLIGPMTTLAVAVVARLVVPDMPLSACIVLGAVVAPPDAVASPPRDRAGRPMPAR